MRKSKNVPARSLTDGARSITFTVSATPEIIERIAYLLMFCEIPTETPKQNEHGPLPWETPEETAAELEALPPTREELHTKAKQLIQSISDTYLPGLDNCKLLLTSFGKPRLSELPDDKLPLFIEALATMPMDPALVPAYIEALHASESLI